MDCSPEYVKMCQKATEIQKAHGLQPPFINRSGLIRTLNYDYFVEGYLSTLETVSWLPRQDQLQAMVETNGPVYAVWALEAWTEKNFEYCRIHEVVRTDPDADVWSWRDRFTSREQLELAYLMDLKFSKRWNGEDWC